MAIVQVSSWIKTQIVKPPKAKERVAMLKRAIALGDEFLKLNNFNGAMEVFCYSSPFFCSFVHQTYVSYPYYFPASKEKEKRNVYKKIPIYKNYQINRQKENP